MTAADTLATVESIVAQIAKLAIQDFPAVQQVDDAVHAILGAFTAGQQTEEQYVAAARAVLYDTTGAVEAVMTPPGTEPAAGK